MKAEEGQLQELRAAAQERGEEQAEALLTFIEGRLQEELDTFDDAFHRDAFRCAVDGFIAGFLNRMEEHDGVEPGLEAAVVHESARAWDELGLMVKHLSKAPTHGLGDRGDEEQGASGGSHEQDVIKGLAAVSEQAAERGETATVNIGSVQCQVDSSGQWSLGFITPDVLWTRGDAEEATFTVDEYLHWYREHFEPVMALCQKLMQQEGGGQPRVFPVSFGDLDPKRPGHAWPKVKVGVTPVCDISSGYVEESDHVPAGEKGQPVRARLFWVMDDVDCVCGVVDTHDDRGRVTAQANLFAFAVEGTGNGDVKKQKALRIKAMAEEWAKKQGVAIAVQEEINMVMCGTHGRLVTPDPGALESFGRHGSDGNVH